MPERRAAQRLFFIVNVDWFFLSHRLPLAQAAQKAGWDIQLLTASTGRFPDLEKGGVPCLEIPFARSFSHPFHELKCVYLLIKSFRDTPPDVIHCVALKAIILGGIAARFCGVKRVVYAVTGMGSMFIKETLFARMYQGVFKLILSFLFHQSGARIIMQNAEDVDYFKREGLAPPDKIELIKGAGVDVNLWESKPELEGGPFICLMPARLLKDKGIWEFMKAARILHKKHGAKILCRICGDEDAGNPTSISAHELQPYIDDGSIEWSGHRKDMKAEFEKCHMVALPSYREGLPKVLIEAGASGRASVTCDVTGCREVIKDGVNGLLVEARNAEKLAERIEWMMEHPLERRRMALLAREIVEQEFALEKVLTRTLRIYETV
ncbi:MAG: glycosyltransferase family 4 protein [Verrucomicrobiota bacterium]|nr:glycosyltransferase family 4 protein [Verrucomicrobiota bacterium]